MFYIKASFNLNLILRTAICMTTMIKRAEATRYKMSLFTTTRKIYDKQINFLLIYLISGYDYTI